MGDQNYLAQLRRHLTCSASSRQRLLEQAGQLVADFFREDPEADAEALTAAFGAPREFAGQMLATLDPEEVEAAKRRRRWLHRGGLAALILALIAVAAVYFVRWRALREIIPEDGYYMVVGPAESVTEKEFEDFFRDPNTSTDESPEIYVDGNNIIQKGN